MESFKINFGLMFFRIMVSLFMLAGHGYGKLLKLFSGEEIKFLDPFGIGATASFVLVVYAEFFASLFIILGIFTRFHSIPLIIAMTVAAFIAHGDDPFSGKEKALLFLVSYILLFITGAGKFSIQSWIDKKVKVKNKMLRYLLG